MTTFAPLGDSSIARRIEERIEVEGRRAVEAEHADGHPSPPYDFVNRCINHAEDGAASRVHELSQRNMGTVAWHDDHIRPRTEVRRRFEQPWIGLRRNDR